MSRGRVCLLWLPLAFAFVFASVAPAWQAPKNGAPDGKSGAAAADGQLPPEEDKAHIEEKYSFNPLQSKKEVGVGEFYFKKGDFNAAASRFREATKWNDGNADAWLRLGDAEEKMKDMAAARAAWEKYLQLAPQAKNAAEIRKKIEKLKG